MNEEIKFSVIIPTYKRSEKLLFAIDSILNQDYKNYEIIVVDDNDEDSVYRKENELKLKKYIAEKRIKYIKHSRNKNGATARNSGIKTAKGDYITFLDDDDEFDIHRLSRIKARIMESNMPDFIYTGCKIKTNGRTIRIIKCQNDNSIRRLIFLLLCQKSFIGTGSNMVCKKSIVVNIKGFDEKFIRHQDIEFLIRYLQKSATVECINENLVIKNNDDQSNVPNVYSLLETKEMFFDKFKEVIDSYNNDEKNMIFQSNYYELFIIACIKNNKEEIKQIEKMLKDKGYYNKYKVIKIKLKQRLKRLIIRNR